MSDNYVQPHIGKKGISIQQAPGIIVLFYLIPINIWKQMSLSAAISSFGVLVNFGLNFETYF